MMDWVYKYSANIQCFAVIVQKQNCATNDFFIYDRLKQMSFILHLKVPCNGIIFRRSIWFGSTDIKITIKRSL